MSLYEALFDITSRGYHVEIWPSHAVVNSLRITIEGHGIKSSRYIAKKDFEIMPINEKEYDKYLCHILGDLLQEVQSVYRKFEQRYS